MAIIDACIIEGGDGVTFTEISPSISILAVKKVWFVPYRHNLVLSAWLGGLIVAKK